MPFEVQHGTNSLTTRPQIPFLLGPTNGVDNRPKYPHVYHPDYFVHLNRFSETDPFPEETALAREILTSNIILGTRIGFEGDWLDMDPSVITADYYRGLAQPGPEAYRWWLIEDTIMRKDAVDLARQLGSAGIRLWEVALIYVNEDDIRRYPLLDQSTAWAKNTSIDGIPRGLLCLGRLKDDDFRVVFETVQQNFSHELLHLVLDPVTQRIIIGRSPTTIESALLNSFAAGITPLQKIIREGMVNLLDYRISGAIIREALEYLQSNLRRQATIAQAYENPNEIYFLTQCDPMTTTNSAFDASFILMLDSLICQKILQRFAPDCTSVYDLPALLNRQKEEIEVYIVELFASPLPDLISSYDPQVYKHFSRRFQSDLAKKGQQFLDQPGNRGEWIRFQRVHQAINERLKHSVMF